MPPPVASSPATNPARRDDATITVPVARAARTRSARRGHAARRRPCATPTREEQQARERRGAHSPLTTPERSAPSDRRRARPASDRERGDPPVEHPGPEVLAGADAAPTGSTAGSGDATAIGAGTPEQREDRRGERRPAGAEQRRRRSRCRHRPATTSTRDMPPSSAGRDPEVQDVVLLNSISCTYGSPAARACSSRWSTSGGMTRAAEAEHVSSPRSRRRSASSRPSSAPRSSTGSGARVVLTAAGEALVEPARQVLRDVETGRAAVEAVAGLDRRAPRPRRAPHARRRSGGAAGRARSGVAHPGVDIALADPGDAADGRRPRGERRVRARDHRRAGRRAPTSRATRSAARTCSRCSRPGSNASHTMAIATLAALPARHRAGGHDDPHPARGGVRRRPRHPEDRGGRVATRGDPPARPRRRRRDAVPATARRAGGRARRGGRRAAPAPRPPGAPLPPPRAALTGGDRVRGASRSARDVSRST